MNFWMLGSCQNEVLGDGTFVNTGDKEIENRTSDVVYSETTVSTMLSSVQISTTVSLLNPNSTLEPYTKNTTELAAIETTTVLFTIHLSGILPDKRWTGTVVKSTNVYNNITGNITNETVSEYTVRYDNFQFTFDVIFGSVLFFCGLFGNIACLFVLPKIRTQRSAMILLTGLTAADSLVLLSSLILKILPGLCIKYKNYTCLETVIYTIVPYVYPVTRMFHTFSVWMVVAVSIDRYIVIANPFNKSKISTAKRAQIITIAVACACVVFHFPLFFQQIQSEHSNRNTSLVEKEKYSSQMVDPWHEKLGVNPYFHYIYYIGLNWVVVYIIPLCLLLFLNIRLWTLVKNAKKEHKKLTKSKSSIDNMVITVNVIIVVSLFILCQLPSFICLVLMNPISGLTDLSVLQAVCVAEFLIAFNSSVNFYVYFLCYRKFRKTAFRVVTCRQQKSRFSYSDTSSSSTRLTSVGRARSFRK